MTRSLMHLLAAVDPAARRLGQYTAYRIAPEEFVGATHMDLQRTARELREWGYETHHLAAAKLHPEPHAAVAHASLRRVPKEHPIGIDARITDEWEPGQCQYHVHLWPSRDGTSVFSHYEVRGDVLRGGFDVERMRAHYRPDYGETYLRGISDIPYLDPEAEP